MGIGKFAALIRQMLLTAVLALGLAGAGKAQETSYSDDCVLATIASVSYNVTEQGIQLKVNLIPKWAEKYNLECLKNIVVNLGGFRLLALLGGPTIGEIICNAIGDLSIR